MRQYIFLLLAQAIFLSACGAAERTTIKCNQILDSRIATANWDTLNATTIRTWVTRNYPGSSAKNTAKDTFGWESNNTYYNVKLSPTLERVIYALNPQPNLREVIGCFGMPSWYEAVDAPASHDSGVRFTVWYPVQGLRFEWNEYGTWTHKEFTEDTPLRSLIVTKPGTLDEQVEKIAGTAFKAEAIKTIKPWPTTTPIKIKVE
jgi:hypothetical protein